MKKPRILTVGSANMDFVCAAARLPLPGETVISEDDYFIAPGGKGANCAVSAARLGADVVFCARVGNDVYGKQLFETYKREQIDCRFLFFDSEEKTGLAQIFREADGQNRITVFPGANRRLSESNVEEAFTCYPDALLLQCEIDPESVRYAVDAAGAQRIPVFFDMAPVRDDFDPLSLGECEVISPNETETEFYTGIRPVGSDGCLRAAIKLHSLVKCKYVVIKLGGRGCFIYDGLHQEFIPSLEVKVTDTTGAGDAFTAALTVRYLQNGGDIGDAARFANCVGAYTVTRSGAFASFPTIKALEEFIRRYNSRA